MKTRVLVLAAGATLALLAVEGCRRQQAPAPPPAPVVQQPAPLTPSSITVITPLPSVPATATPNVQPAPAATPPVPTSTAKKTRRRHARRASEPAQTASRASGQAAAAPEAKTETVAEDGQAATATAAATQPEPAQPTAGSLNGLWSTGTVIDTQERTRLLNAIAVQEQRITTIRNPSQTDTAALLVQVRTFLTKARQAVADNDLDGAQTLNTKARVLLDELQGS